MYSELLNVQIIISLFKQFNIKDVVISPGSRNTPFVHSIENDSDFRCYSIVDERSAGYFALGLAESLDAPVVLSCTSSTATCNYLPAIKLANEKKIKLIAFTADRDYRNLYQMEDQMIDQIDMYNPFTLSSINVPIVKDTADIRYVERIVNKIIIENLQKKSGPIQINMQVDKFGYYTKKELPKARKIDYITADDYKKEINTYRSILKNKKRILVLCGCSHLIDDKLREVLCLIQENYPAVVSYDAYSASKSDDFVKTCLVTETMDEVEFDMFSPDLVITIGNHVWSFIKYKLRNTNKQFEHWNISTEGEFKDGFGRLNKVFEMKEIVFFELLLDGTKVKNEYLALWKKRVEGLQYPEDRYSNFYAIKNLLSKIPEKSLVHMSILNSIRISNFTAPLLTQSCYANLGTDGIDGCLSTFLGESLNYGGEAYLIIGDLSSLYDANSFSYVGNHKVKIMIINNHVGSEFFNNFASYMDNVGNFIAAEHNSSFANLCNMDNVKYMSAKNQKEFDCVIEKFISCKDSSCILEVFTNPKVDSSVLKEFYQLNKDNSLGHKLRKLKKRLIERRIR